MAEAKVERRHREAAVGTEHSVPPVKLMTYLIDGDLNTCVGAHRFERVAQALATAEQQGKEAGQATDGVAVRFIAARSIKADSWLHDDRHEHAREFRAFYAYVRNKTNAIQACHAASPEDLYYIISFFDHWRARVKDGLEPDWRAEPPSKPEGG